MSAYGILREFADSWGLLALVLIFLGVVLFTFRPGSGKIHADMAKLPLRNEDAPGAEGADADDGGGR